MSTFDEKNRTTAELHQAARTALDRAVGAAIESTHAYHEGERAALLRIAEALDIKPPMWSGKDLNRVVDAVRDAVERQGARVLAENERGGEARAVVADVARLLGLDLSTNRPLAMSEMWSPANMARVTDAVRVLVDEQRGRVKRAEAAEKRVDELSRELDNVNTVNDNLKMRLALANSVSDELRKRLRNRRDEALTEARDAIDGMIQEGK